MNITTNVTAAALNITQEMPERNKYGALKGVPSSIMALAYAAMREIGFTKGIETTNRGKGFIANNFEIYGYDVARQLVAMQLRQSWKAKANHWLNTSKVYCIAGIDEGQSFCHAIPSSFQRIKNLDETSPEAVVKWAESKIFRVPVERLAGIIRQGDVALVPVRSIPRDAQKMDSRTLTLRGSHHVTVDGDAFEQDGRHWIDGVVQIDHTPGQHRSIDAEGRFEIVLGARRDDFTFIDANTAD
jgi:hypothetical protein